MCNILTCTGNTALHFDVVATNLVFTLYRIVKWSVAKCVSDRVFVHAGNTSSGTFFAPEQDRSAVESGTFCIG